VALMEDLAAAAAEHFYCHFLMGAEEGVIFDYFSHLDLWVEAAKIEVSALFGH
jgi:hypothetical protein